MGLPGADTAPKADDPAFFTSLLPMLDKVDGHIARKDVLIKVASVIAGQRHPAIELPKDLFDAHLGRQAIARKLRAGANRGHDAFP